MLIKNPTQCERVLNILREANDWVDGMTFLRLDRPITQYHARIFELESEGYKIEHGWVENKNWKKYRLVKEQLSLNFK